MLVNPQKSMKNIARDFCDFSVFDVVWNVVFLTQRILCFHNSFKLMRTFVKTAAFGSGIEITLVGSNL